MENGFIVLWRKSLNNPLFQKPFIWHYWTYCLLKASHKPERFVWNKKEVMIKRGEFMTGRKVASLETGLSQQNIRTAQETLINMGMIEKSTSKSTSKYTVLVIVKYSDYQDKKKKSTSKSTSSQPAANQQPTTYNNVNNVNKYKREDFERLLLDTEYITTLSKTLNITFSESKEHIQNVFDYCASRGKWKYVDLAAVYRSWNKKKNKEPKQPEFERF